jgi:hypothetical protein
LALELADRDDLRVTAGLTELLTFRTVPVWDERTRRGATELMRLLSLHLAAPNPGTFTSEFFKLLRRKLGPFYPAPNRFLPPSRAARTDMTDEQADLLVTFVRVLAQSETEENRMLLLRIATHPAVTPNRRFVQEAAQAFTSPVTDSESPIHQRLTPLSPNAAGNAPNTVTLKRP